MLYLRHTGHSFVARSQTAVDRRIYNPPAESVLI